MAPPPGEVDVGFKTDRNFAQGKEVLLGLHRRQGLRDAKFLLPASQPSAYSFVFFVHKICAWFLLVRFFSLHETRTIFSNFPPRRYGITMDDLKDFRQLDSITPGHPENFATPGVEVSTGPLGQGISNAVGMAIAERHLAATFNKPDCKVGLDFCRKLRF